MKKLNKKESASMSELLGILSYSEPVSYTHLVRIGHKKRANKKEKRGISV